MSSFDNRHQHQHHPPNGNRPLNDPPSRGAAAPPFSSTTASSSPHHRRSHSSHQPHPHLPVPPPPPPPLPPFIHPSSPTSGAGACIVELQGRSLLAPYSSFSRAVVMGNELSSSSSPPLHSSSSSSHNRIRATPPPQRSSPPPPPPSVPRTTNRSHHPQTQQSQQQQEQRPMSNLSVLLYQQEQREQQQQQQQQQRGGNEFVNNARPLPASNAAAADEADSASGPSTPPTRGGNNAAVVFTGAAPASAPSGMLHPSAPPSALNRSRSGGNSTTRRDNNNNNNIGASNLLQAEGGGGGGGLSRMHSSTGQVARLLPERVRRCMSSKELKTLAPPSGSPYEYMLHKKEELEATTRQRLQEIKQLATNNETSFSPSTTPPPPPATTATITADPQLEQRQQQQQQHRHLTCDVSNASTTSSSVGRRRAGANESRKGRRTMHNQAVVDDLCEVVADLFIAESKLLKPLHYGVPARLTAEAAGGEDQRKEVSRRIHDFVSALPSRYALGADTPSEVLLHMRLMAAARSDRTKAVVHIHNLQDDDEWSRTFSAAAAATAKNAANSLRLVTIACNDAQGLLELITKALATGGSRVLDADVMLSTDGIVLDRFVVEMNGRLRLDKLAQLIESLLKERAQQQQKQQSPSGETDTRANSSGDAAAQQSSSEPTTATTTGPIYFKEQESPTTLSFLTPQAIQREMETAVPLSQVLASNSSRMLAPEIPRLRKMHSMPAQLPQQATINNNNNNIALAGGVASGAPLPSTQLAMRKRASSDSIEAGVSIQLSPPQEGQPEQPEQQQQTQIAVPSNPPTALPESVSSSSRRQRRPLVNRRGSSDLDQFGSFTSNSAVGPGSSGVEEEQSLDYVTVPSSVPAAGSQIDGGSPEVENRVVPLIPFDELMLIETIGTGRVSTIYRAAWQHGAVGREHLSSVQMVALKVAMVNPETGDPSHVNELRREADIAARLQHPNICDLVGVAADAECFCLAYDFCEGGSLLSLLSDSKRYYEYLPIALDIANGMAYLHSRDVIHRDLKPSNILLTRDHRAKIADFGMSVNFKGQELTAETGTYRYMAPEVIRHESYSSNADVYSFGLCLWQLITRQVPFSTMTPIQAAYAVAEGRRPEIPASTPRRLREIILACWEQESHRRPSFTYIAMALADYAKMAFSPANVGALTLQIANEMLANVDGNSTVNVDFTTPVTMTPPPSGGVFVDAAYPGSGDSFNSDIGLEI